MSGTNPGNWPDQGEEEMMNICANCGKPEEDHANDGQCPNVETSYEADYEVSEDGVIIGHYDKVQDDCNCLACRIHRELEIDNPDLTPAEKLFTAADLKAAKLETVERLFEMISARMFYASGASLVNMEAVDDEAMKLKEEING